MAGDLSSIVEPGAGFQQLATGFVFTEGPLWGPDGYLYFVDIRQNLLCRVRPGSEYEVVRRETGAGNGMTLDPDGNRLLCEGRNRRVTRTHPNGRIEVVAERWNRRRINSPNDLISRPDGTIYFTDPPWAVEPFDRQLDFAGVFRVSPDGEVTAEAKENSLPNGLAMSPDGRRLYVSNTRPDPYINVYPVNADGSLGAGERFADLPYGPDGPSGGVPDGMKVDESGRVYCTGAGGAWVFAPDGSKLGVIEPPELPANLAFGGDDRRTLFFTSRTSVYSIRVQTPGMPVVY